MLTPKHQNPINLVSSVKVREVRQVRQLVLETDFRLAFSVQSYYVENMHVLSESFYTNNTVLCTAVLPNKVTWEEFFKIPNTTPSVDNLVMIHNKELCLY